MLNTLKVKSQAGSGNPGTVTLGLGTSGESNPNSYVAANYAMMKSTDNRDMQLNAYHGHLSQELLVLEHL